MSKAERKRDSAGDADRKMLELIESYAQAKNLEIHGYYNDLMIKNDGATSESGPSKFHAELAVFGKNVVGKPKMISNYTQEQLSEINKPWKYKS